jgi:hypothetical protein
MTGHERAPVDLSRLSSYPHGMSKEQLTEEAMALPLPERVTLA